MTPQQVIDRNPDALAREMARPSLDATEDAFQKAVIKLAHDRGWKVAHFRPALTAKGWRTPMEGDTGYPDLTLARNGVTLHWELKAKGNKPSKDQEAWAVALGGRVLWPKDWDYIWEALK